MNHQQGQSREECLSKEQSDLEKLEEKKQESAILQLNTAKPEKHKSKEIDLG